MSIKLNLSEIRKRLNEGKCLVLVYEGKSSVPRSHDCVVFTNNVSDDSNEYGFIDDIITPDKKELLNILKLQDGYQLMLESSEEGIRSSLTCRRYTDPMDLMKDYYNLPFLSVTHPKLKTSLHRLNEALGETIDTSVLSKATNYYYHPNQIFQEHHSIHLNETKDALVLCKKQKESYHNPKSPTGNPSDLPF